MSQTLLATKTYPPCKSESTVRRPRLLALLDAGLLAHRRMVLISSPAGSGKSTLLVDWAGSLKAPAAWFSVDKTDNDIYQFWSYVVSAIQTRFPAGCEGDSLTGLLKDLGAAQPRAVADILSDLINTLARLASSDRPVSSCAIILDDYHLVENQAVHESLIFFVDHLPPGVQVVIATRTDPPLPLHLWRARSQLVELRSADLRFTDEEAEAFLNDVMGLRLGSSEVYQLGLRTEGWAVGLQLAGLSLRGRQDTAAFIERFSGSHRFVLEYLTNEVLSQQPSEVEAFLLATCILEKMCPDLCDAVLREVDEAPELDGGSRAILDCLERSNLFLVSLDDQREWYRYHHLFAELLRVRLARQGADRIKALHQRAAEWYAGRRDIDDALHHALAAGNTIFAADLVIRNWLKAGFEGRVRTALRWVEMLPREMVVAHPLLSAANAYLLYLAGLRGPVEEHIQHCRQALADWAAKGYDPHDGYDYSALNAEMSVLQANLEARKGNFGEAVQAAREALRLAPADKAQVQGIGWNALAHALRETGCIEEAIQAYHHAIRWNLASGNIIAISIAARRLSHLYMIQGDFQGAEEALRSTLEQAEQAGRAHLPAYGVVYVTLGDVCYERNELEKASHWLEKGREQGKPGGSLDWLISCAILDARLRGARGDLPSAIGVLDEVCQTVHRMDEPVTEAKLAAWRARFQVAAGRLEEASVWAERVSRQIEPGPGFTHGIELFTLIRLLLAQGRTEEAGALAERLGRAAAQTRSAGRQCEASLLQAEAEWIRPRPDWAVDLLSQALALSGSRGSTRLFLDEGQLVEAMLRALVRSARPGEPAQARAAYLLQLMPGKDGKEEEGSPILSRRTLRSSALSDRETEVLALLALGFSNPEIAERLVVSMATVKTHVSHIFDKLDVQNRAEAVARGKEMGLI